MTAITTVLAKLILAIDDVNYAITGADLSFESDGINTAICTLACGYGSSGGHGAAPSALGFQFGNKSTKFVRGTPATISLGHAGNFTSEGGTIFTGYVDEGGPSGIQSGNFVVRVKLVGQLHALNTGTLQLSNIIPTSYADTSQPISVFTAQSVEPPYITPEEVLTDFGKAVVASFTQLASGKDANGEDLPEGNGVVTNNTVINILRETFNTGINQQATDILKKIVPHLLLRSQDVGFACNLWYLYNSLLSNDFRYESFLGRMHSLGQMLGFRIIETPAGLALMPFSPFIIKTVATDLLPSTYSSLNWTTSGNTQYIGCALVAGNCNTGDNLLAGLYKRPGNPTGVVLTRTAPPFIRMADSRVDGSPSDARMPWASDEARAIVGDAMAREYCLEAAYSQKSLTVTCPYLRTDIGQLTAVRVVYPRVVEDVAGAEVYGSVLRVRISIDATSQHASTTYDIGYLRSSEQQRIEIDADTETSGIPHPIWSQNVYRTKLDEVYTPTGFTFQQP